MDTITTENYSISIKVVQKFWPVAALVLIVFILNSFLISNDYLTGWIYLISLFLLTTLMPICLRTNKVLLASNILPAIGMVTVMTFLFTGGPADTGFWWSITYVIGVFMVTTKKWAVFWLSLYLIFSIIIVFLSLKGVFKIAYPIQELLNLLIVFVITFVFVYSINQVREYYLLLANKRAEKLLKLNKELTFANKELEEFAYVASHDLQEPLQTIANFAGLLEEQYSGKLDEDAELYLRYIVNSSDKMKTLIKDILELSRVGRNVLFAPVNCNIILKEVIDQMEISIKQSDAKITSSNLPILQGNATELKLLFQNLISNAIKFNKDNNTPNIEIFAIENNEGYLFSFKDNGIGIEEKYKDRIFVIFQRLHTTEEYSGTGIGLATCKKIVALHNGNIWMESKIGEGSTFYFTLSK